MLLCLSVVLCCLPFLSKHLMDDKVMYMCLGVDYTFLLDEGKDMLVATKRIPDTQHPGVYIHTSELHALFNVE